MPVQLDPLTEDEMDCTEGCDHAPGTHKWEIEPSPMKDFDVFVTEDDAHALEMLQQVCELTYDQMKAGEEVIIKIRMNNP